jgi:hypothetical protein
LAVFPPRRLAEGGRSFCGLRRELRCKLRKMRFAAQRDSRSAFLIS